MYNIVSINSLSPWPEKSFYRDLAWTTLKGACSITPKGILYIVCHGKGGGGLRASVTYYVHCPIGVIRLGPFNVIQARSL